MDIVIAIPEFLTISDESSSAVVTFFYFFRPSDQSNIAESEQQQTSQLASRNLQVFYS